MVSFYIARFIRLMIFVAHKCMFPGCGKDFSRHDNLGQHIAGAQETMCSPTTTIPLSPPPHPAPESTRRKSVNKYNETTACARDFRWKLLDFSVRPHRRLFLTMVSRPFVIFWLSFFLVDAFQFELAFLRRWLFSFLPPFASCPLLFLWASPGFLFP